MSKTEITADELVASADSEPLSRAVVAAVAEAEGVDQSELDPLYYAIDPDQLDSLFRPQFSAPGAPDAAAEIRFTYHGYEVRATATGQVDLTER